MTQRFGEKLAQLRQQHGRTRTELAQQLGFISRAHIANLETGRDVPSLSIAVRLAEHLDVTLDSLLRDDREFEVVQRLSAPPAHDETVLASFRERLRALRRQRTMKQWQLADALQLGTRAYISDLEIGRRLPSIELVIKIADFFEVTIDSLFQPTQASANTEAAFPPEVADE
jgi:transcriptional regulator with XRE-family HTH domain